MNQSFTYRRMFYVAIAGLMAAIALIGFWPSYFKLLLTFVAERSFVIHIHAAIYVGWLALFGTQAVLAATGQIRRHRSLGRIGIAYGALVIVAGLVVTLYQYAGEIEANGLEESLEYPTWPLIDMAIFAPFFGFAVAYRNRPEIHKRLIIVAFTALLIAPAGRMPVPESIIPFIWFSPILLGIAYDGLRIRRIHPVYVIGITVLFVSRFRDSLMQTEAWPAFTRWIGSFLM